MIRKRQPIHLVWPTSKAVRATHDTNEGDAALALNLEMGERSKNPRGDRGCGQRLRTHRPAEDHLDKILAMRHRHDRDNKQVRPLVTRKVNREPTSPAGGRSGKTERLSDAVA